MSALFLIRPVYVVSRVETIHICKTGPAIWTCSMVCTDIQCTPTPASIHSATGGSNAGQGVTRILAILFAPKSDETMFDRQYARYTAWKAGRPPRSEPVAPSEPWHAKARRMLKRKPRAAEAPRQSSSRRSTQSRKSPDWVDPYLDPPEIKVREKTSDKQKAA
jgi:hypothetical protein